MPYIITTLHPWADQNEPARRARTRTAVATLDEARETVAPTILAASPSHVWHLAESGGTIGPLPDGTVIEVRPVTNGELIRMTPARAIGQYFADGPIAAFNGAHA